MKGQPLTLVLLFFTILFFWSCDPKGEKQDPPSLNSPEQNKYASWFKIHRNSDHSLLITYLDTERTDSVTYVLYKGKKPETYAKAYCIKTPVAKAACLTSVFVGFLNRLGVLPQIAAVDNLDFISDPYVLQNAAKGEVKELSKNGQLNIEATLLSGVQVIFTNPSGDVKKDLDQRLISTGITPVVCADYYENHPLGRAEWIKVFALFFGLEDKADSLFSATEKKYLALKQSADTCKYRPTVFTELKTNDTWFVAGGKSSPAQLLADAGADYIWKDNGKVNVTALNMEQVIQKALHADYWLNLHTSHSAAEILAFDKRYGEFKAFRNGNLYNNNAKLNAKGGNSYWENGLSNPDEILSDLVHIFHPNLQPGKELTYYKQLK